MDPGDTAAGSNHTMTLIQKEIKPMRTSQPRSYTSFRLVIILHSYQPLHASPTKQYALSNCLVSVQYTRSESSVVVFMSRIG